MSCFHASSFLSLVAAIQEYSNPYNTIESQICMYIFPFPFKSLQNVYIPLPLSIYICRDIGRYGMYGVIEPEIVRYRQIHWDMRDAIRYTNSCRVRCGELPFSVHVSYICLHHPFSPYAFLYPPHLLYLCISLSIFHISLHPCIVRVREACGDIVK